MKIIWNENEKEDAENEAVAILSELRCDFNRVIARRQIATRVSSGQTKCIQKDHLEFLNWDYIREEIRKIRLQRKKQENISKIVEWAKNKHPNNKTSTSEYWSKQTDEMIDIVCLALDNNARESGYC